MKKSWDDIVVHASRKVPKGIEWEVDKKSKSAKHGDVFRIKVAFKDNDLLMLYRYSRFLHLMFIFLDVKGCTASMVVLRSDYIGVHATPLIEYAIRELWHIHDLPQCTPKTLKEIRL